MRVSYLTLAGATATAFLIVPDIPINEDTFSILPFEEEPEPISRTDSVSVPCYGCRGKDARLDLDFQVENGMLLVNNVPLLPKIDGPYVANVLSSDESPDAVNLGVVLGLVGPGSFLLGPQDLRAADIYFTIREVDGVWMDDIPSVKLEILESSDGKVATLGDITVIEPEVPRLEDINFPSHTESRLHGLFRKLKGKGCRGKNRHHGQPVMLSGEQDDELVFHHHPHHHHHHHDVGAGIDRFAQVLGHVASYIFMPLFLGLVAGFGSAFIALIVVSLAMKVVSLFRGRKETSDIIVVEESAVDEKARLMMAEVDELPQYEDTPAYEQPEVKQ